MNTKDVRILDRTNVGLILNFSISVFHLGYSLSFFFPEIKSLKSLLTLAHLLLTHMHSALFAQCNLSK